MNVVVTRDTKTSFSTIGKMTVDGEFQYYTLEPPVREDGVKPRAIPLGQYAVTVRWSKKFDKLMPHVENVPDFEAIEIHPGNFPSDTEGCCLVGFAKPNMPDMIGDSRRAFVDLFARMTNAIEKNEAITITYTEAA